MGSESYLESIRKDNLFSETLRGQVLRFRTTWGLFSPKEIDAGTRLLLRHIEVGESDDCLDLGCGYGPIGLTLARLAPHGRTLMVDKDFVAVEYARRNIEQNVVGNAEVMLSNGFQHIGERSFDLIASNVPAKVGKELLHILLQDAKRHLRPGGRLYLVSITGLRRLFQRELKAIFGNYEKLKQGEHYTVARAVKTAGD